MAASVGKVAPFESGRRLCLLFQSGSGRYAVEATSVTEVAPPDEDGHSIRGSLELHDLSVMLGGAPEVRPGMGLVLDVSPTLAVRIREVQEVADVSRDPFFLLPPIVGEAAALIFRAAILHEGKLYLELIADMLPQVQGLKFAGPARPVLVADEVPDRALVFESQGRLFGIPLGLVSQVVSQGGAFCALPLSSGPAPGLFPHAQVLWPIYSVPGLMGGEAPAEELFVLAELAGQNIGLCASRALGVHQGFKASDASGEFATPSLPSPVLFLDLQRMFS